MGYCAICENEFFDSKLKKVISKKGITRVCQGCFRDDMPLFKEPEDYQFEGIYKKKSVYERLSHAAGLKDPEEHKKRISEFGKTPGTRADDSLRRIVNKNFEKKVKEYPKNEDLVDNFHWIIMRARRSKKVSQRQMADAIQEPESSIVMAEKGFIPQGSDFFVRKIENFLRIRISKKILDKIKENNFDPDAEKNEILKRFEDKGEFDDEIIRNLTTSDLKDYKNKKRKWWQFGKKSGFSEEDVSYEEGEELLDEER